MHDIDRSVPPARRSRVFNPSEDEEEDTRYISCIKMWRWYAKNKGGTRS